MTFLFHTCGHGRFYAPDDSALGSTVQSKTDRPLTIDMHCHMATVAVEKLVADTPQKKGEFEFLKRMYGESSTAHNQKMFASAEMRSKLSDVDTRLNEMEAMGVDIQVISPSPGQYYYWAD